MAQDVNSTALDSNSQREFPLYQHKASGHWCKTIRGKRYYFGKDRAAALERWIREKTGVKKTLHEDKRYICELGAYRLTPTLETFRDFLVQNPGEVVVLVIEDYVEPAHLEAAFIESGLIDFVYRGEIGPPWPTLRELCDRGVPFTLTTTEPTSAHLQAVIGYDGNTETIIIRDPMEPHYRETVAESFLKQYEAHGPRGLLFML